MRALVFLLLLAPAVSGQTFERFGVREGLPSEITGDVALGPDGLLWIGTEDGLARYDGHGFRVWRHRADDAATIPSSRVGAVLPVEGAVWVGTAAGVARLDLRSGRFERPTALPDGAVADLVRDADGRIWAGFNDRGLWRLSPETGRVRPVRFGTSQRYRVIALATDGDDVWAEVAPPESPAQVCRLDPARAVCVDSLAAERWRLLNDQGRAVLVRHGDDAGWVDWLASGERWPSAPAEAFRSVLRVGPDEAWFRSAGALVAVRADGATGSFPIVPRSRGRLGGYDVRALTRDRQGNVWVGTEAGLYLARRPAPAFRAVQRDPADPASLGDDRVNGMGQDDRGRVWIATNGGLFRLTLATGAVEAVPTDTDEPATARAFWQVLPRGGDRALVGLKGGGVAAWTGDKLRALPFEVGGVRTLAVGPEGDVWAGGLGGLWRFSEDAVWDAPERGSVGPIDAERVPLPVPRNVPVNVVAVVGDGPAALLWVGTDDGVWRRRADTAGPGHGDAGHGGTDTAGPWEPVAAGSLCAPIVWSMTTTPADPGAVWAATVGGGLARIDADDRVTCVTDRDGLPTNSVYGVLADADGRLWASTTSGLARVDPATGAVATFSSADGLAGDAFNLMGQLRLRDGRLAFGGSDGLTVVDPAAVEARGPPAVAVTGVERQGRLLRGVPAVLRLAHDEGAFGVRFAAADFRAPRRNRYRYRLVGLDDDWQTTDGSAPRAAYVGVPPGRYRFEVRGAAADTPFSGAVGLDVVVVPAVWQRAWFRVAAGLLAIALVVGATIAISSRRRRGEAREQAEAVEIRRRLAEAREQERLRIARDLHDGPVQTLYRVGHDLDRLSEHDGGISPVRTRVGRVAGELRQILTDLRPTLVDHLGLGGALKALARRAEERFPDLEVSIVDQTQRRRPAAGRLALFRIAQEALQNAGRHAGPARVTVTLDDHDGGTRLRITDDGCGFALPARMVELARAQHFGLVGAQEQAAAVGGTFAVRSAPGAGTTVEAWVPGAEPGAG